MATPSADFRAWLTKHETVSVQELESKLTCSTARVLTILKVILNRSQFSATERLYSKTLLKHYDLFKEYLPKNPEEAQLMKDRTKAAKNPRKKKGESPAATTV